MAYFLSIKDFIFEKNKHNNQLLEAVILFDKVVMSHRKWFLQVIKKQFYAPVTIDKSLMIRPYKTLNTL